MLDSMTTLPNDADSLQPERLISVSKHILNHQKKYEEDEKWITRIKEYQIKWNSNISDSSDLFIFIV